MNTVRQTRVVDGDGQPRTRASKVIRWAGLAAMIAGIIFAGIQPIHPPDALSSVTTSGWAIITGLKTIMCFLFLLGIAGLYARQVEEAGWLGLAGAILFGLSWWLQTGFVFPEPLILPVLAPEAPKFVASFLTLANGAPAEMNIGALPTVYALVGICYLLGGVLFGIATYRARVLPRWAGAFLAFAAVFSLAKGVIPHPLDRFAAVPFGLAVAYLGFALLTERRAPAADPCADSEGLLVPQPQAV